MIYLVLNNILEWSNKWGMKVNSIKSVVLSIIDKMYPRTFRIAFAKTPRLKSTSTRILELQLLKTLIEMPTFLTVPLQLLENCLLRRTLMCITRFESFGLCRLY